MKAEIYTKNSNVRQLVQSKLDGAQYILDTHKTKLEKLTSSGLIISGATEEEYAIMDLSTTVAKYRDQITLLDIEPNNVAKLEFDL